MDREAVCISLQDEWTSERHPDFSHEMECVTICYFETKPSIKIRMLSRMTSKAFSKPARLAGQGHGGWDMIPIPRIVQRVEVFLYSNSKGMPMYPGPGQRLIPTRSPRACCSRSVQVQVTRARLRWLPGPLTARASHGAVPRSDIVIRAVHR